MERKNRRTLQGIGETIVVCGLVFLLLNLLGFRPPFAAAARAWYSGSWKGRSFDENSLDHARLGGPSTESLPRPPRTTYP